jgi:hypothetical protein
MRPMVAALKRLGGSATMMELYEAVVDDMKLTEEQLSVIHDPERGIKSSGVPGGEQPPAFTDTRLASRVPSAPAASGVEHAGKPGHEDGYRRNEQTLTVAGNELRATAPDRCR